MITCDELEALDLRAWRMEPGAANDARGTYTETLKMIASGESLWLSTWSARPTYSPNGMDFDVYRIGPAVWRAARALRSWRVSLGLTPYVSLGRGGACRHA